VIAAAKFGVGVVSGSTAMVAEAAHSVADTSNQGFLLASIRLGTREPTPTHPFGHGQQRFLWTFLASLIMFLAGAVFAIGYGIYELASGGRGEGDLAVAYVVLAVAFVAEGISWARALRQTRTEVREAGKPLLRHVRQSRDPNMKMVLFEDSAALIGVLLAAVGLALHAITRQAFWDQAASIAIGVLLMGVAVFIGHDAQDLLIGTSVRPEEREAIERSILEHYEVVSVIELLTLVLGPRSLLVPARVDLDDELDAGRVEEVSSEIARRLRELVPDVTEVFLDATPGDHPAG
jgi:cation diffusion facilitator family transporter